MSKTVIQLKMALNYYEVGQYVLAAAQCESVLQQNPNDLTALKMLGIIRAQNGKQVGQSIDDALALNRSGRNMESIGLLESLLKENPNDVLILCALGSANFHLNQFNKSQNYLERALKIDPEFAEAHAVLGNCLINQANIFGAMQEFERSNQISRFNQAVYSSYLFYMAFHPDYDGERLSQENKAWGKSYENNITPFIHPVPDVRRPDQLRIGYISYEFSTHVTSFYFDPLLSRHDHNRFEIYCYAGNDEVDKTTRRLSTYADHWRDVSGLDAAQTAQMINDDGIHIMISASSYLAKHRLPLAYRPAPIQVCYQNRASTIGFKTVDYLITEELADPTGEAEDLYLEKLVRLTHRTCYSAPPDCPDVGKPPVLQNGYITFGTFNNIAKITPQVASAWAEILKSVNGARLLIKNIVFAADDNDWNPLRDMLYANGVDLARVDFLPYFKERNDHLAAYRNIDIVLDTFPFNGGATCCDALWMGVPVVALVGVSFCRGQAGEYLTKLGLTDLITRSEDTYKAAAIKLAGDPGRISELRKNLRSTMQMKMLDYNLHVTEMMTTYDYMWELYVAGKPPEAFNVTSTVVSPSPVPK